MKKIFVLTIMACTLGLNASAQVQKPKTTRSEVKVTGSSKAENYAVITFDTLRCNLGTFPSSHPVRKCSFNFTNTGTAPLIINQAFASCGCTVPTYTKDPIRPGERGTIDVTYDGDGRFPGRFQKTVTVRTNAKNEIVRLVIEGVMTE